MTTPANARLRIAIVGAGAVGCYYGGMLARAGHEVVLIGRPAHVTAIQAQGLRFEAHDLDEAVALQASIDPSAVRGASHVLVCVKSNDTEQASAEIAPHLDADALVLSLQNGVDNAERLRAALGRPVAAVVVYVASEMAGPGHLRHHGRGELVVEPAPGIEPLVQAFVQAGVPCDTSPNVRGALWAKLVLNCAYNALSAITRLPYGVLVQGVGVQQVMNDAVAECQAVAQAEGVQIPGDVALAVRRIAETMPEQQSSTAQDLARGKRSEIDHLNGFVVRRGESHGVPTPVNRALHAIVKLIEARDAQR
jgi:2-dehydropantoate 2-reductase